MEIGVGPENLAALLSKKISVPDFQRNYAWGQNEIDPFLQDIVAAAQSPNPEHFFGPLVILNSDNERLLVDGQQRITTAVMSISILRDYVWVEMPTEEAQYHQAGMFMDLRGLLHSLLFDPANPLEPKFESNYQLSHLFRKGVLEHPKSDDRITFTKNGAGLTVDEIRVSKELRAAFLRIKTQIYSWLETGEIGEQRPDLKDWDAVRTRVLQLRAVLTNGFGIHSMVLTNESDAFILFETLNERGLKLSPADLLKTLIMREVQIHEGRDMLPNVLADWDKTNENVGEYPFSKFLRHHLLTVKVGPIQMRKVFALFKEEVSGPGGRARRELGELKVSSSHYKTLLEVYPFSRLSAFSETHRVLLLAAFNANLAQSEKLLVARAVEYLAFRWIITGKNAQVLENFYQTTSKTVHEVRETEGKRKFLESIYDFAPNDLDFKAALKGSESEPLQKYLLRRVEMSNGGLNAWSDNLTLEHLAPQSPANPDADWLSHVPTIQIDDIEVDYERQVGFLGNLTLLEKELNSQIQNFSWQIKVSGQSDAIGYKGLTASGPVLNNVLCEIPQWNGNHIQKRSDYLVDAGVKLFSKEWVRQGDSFPLAPWKPNN
jgi:hypothetical protein